MKKGIKSFISFMLAGAMTVSGMTTSFTPTYALAAETEAETAASVTVQTEAAPQGSVQDASAETDAQEETAGEQSAASETAADTEETTAAPSGQTENTPAKAEDTKETRYIVALPLIDGVQYDGIDADHKSEEYSDDKDTVLLYNEGENVTFKVKSDYTYSVYDQKNDKKIVESKDVKDGVVAFKMPASDLIVQFVIPDDPAPETESKAEDQTDGILPMTEAPPQTEVQEEETQKAEVETAEQTEVPETEELKAETETASETQTETQSETEMQPKTETEVQTEAQTEVDLNDLGLADETESEPQETIEVTTSVIEDATSIKESLSGYLESEGLTLTEVVLPLDIKPADLSKVTGSNRVELKDLTTDVTGTTLFHQKADGWETVPYTAEDGSIVFETSSFSPFVFAKTEAAPETEALYNVYSEDSDDFTVTFKDGRQQYEAGETVKATVTPSDGISIDSVTVREIVSSEDAKETESAASGAPVEAPESMDIEANAPVVITDEFIDVTTKDQEPDSVMKTNASGTTVSLPDGTSAPQEISFKMPKKNVAVMPVIRRVMNDDADIKKVHLDNNHDGGKYFMNWENSGLVVSDAEGRFYTILKTITITLSDGTTQKTTGFCVDPATSDPASRDYTKYDKETDEGFKILADGSRMGKALYYLYKGPAWGKTITGTDGKDYNLRSIIQSYGGKSEDAYAVATHYVLARIFHANNQEAWDSYFHGDKKSPVFNKKGHEFIDKMVDAINQLPNPETALSVSPDDTLKSSINSDGKVVSPSITYKTIEENSAKISLPDGAKLVTSTGEVKTGSTVTIPGGTTFHLEMDNVEQKHTQTYSVTPSIGVDFVPMRVNPAYGQIVAFTYKSKGSLSFKVQWEPSLRYAYVKKVSSKPIVTKGNNCYSLIGAKFHLVGQKTGKTYDLTTNKIEADGSAVSDTIKVVADTYTVTETAVPKGYKKAENIQPVTVSSVNVQSNPAVINAADEPIVSKANIDIKKILPDGTLTTKKMENAVFTVQYFDNYDGSGDAKNTWKVKTLATYDADRNPIYTASLDAAHLVDGQLVYGDNTVPLGTLKIKEETAPSGYLINENTFTVHITQNGNSAKVSSETTTVGNKLDVADDHIKLDVKEEPKFGSIQIRKADKDLKFDGPQGDASLKGAEFQIINNNSYSIVTNESPRKTYEPQAVIMTITTDENGFAQTPDKFLQADSAYTVREVKAPEGYDPYQDLNVTIPDEDGAVAKDSYGLNPKENPDDILEPVYRGGLSVQKQDWYITDDKPEGAASFEGAEFSITNTSAHHVVVKGVTYEKGEEIANTKLVTDKNGYAATGSTDLPYGTYTIKETKAPEGYRLNPGIGKVEIREKGKIVAVSSPEKDNSSKWREHTIMFDLKVFKFKPHSQNDDYIGDKVNPVQGVEIQIINKNDRPVHVGGKDYEKDAVVATIITDEKGVASTKQIEDDDNVGTLPYGKYLVHESKNPEGLKPFDDFIVDGTNSGGVYDGKMYDENYRNQVPIESPYIITKKDGETGKPVAVGVAGTTFQILESDKTVHEFKKVNSSGDVEKVTDITISESGKVSLPNKLPYGTYYIHETKAPEGYALPKEDKKFTVTELRQWANPAKEDLLDTPQKFQVKIEKTDRSTKEKLAGAVFEIRAAEDIVTGDKTVRVKKGDVADTVTIGEDGTGLSKELYLGKYNVQEKSAPKGFMLNDEIFPVEGTYQGQEIDVFTLADPIKVTNQPTSFNIFKKDTDGTAVPGVTFEVKRIGGEESEGADFAKAVDGVTFTTDKEGHAAVSYLVSGIYSVTETAVPAGFILNTEPRYFTIDKDGHIFESDEKGTRKEDGENRDWLSFEWVNQYTSVAFSKVDVNGDTEIPGAKMSVKDEKGDVISILGDDNVTMEKAEWVSGDQPHMLKKIPAGKYILHEEAAPDGYVVATDIPFEVTETEVVQNVTMKDKRVLISKTDVTGSEEIPGAVMRVKDEDGNEVDSWTSTDKPHAVRGLKVGQTYTLTETLAPAGYILSTESISFTVADDGADQKVAMKNKKVLVTKTDMAGSGELPGAHLTVTDKDDKTVDEWVSTTEPHAVKDLAMGEKYTLTETKPADGYVTAESIEFEVTDDMSKDQTVTMKDDVTKIYISKKDITNGEELPGAHLVIKDDEGNTAAEWDSTTEPHYIEKLPIGTYSLVETKPADGYATAETVTFEVKDTGEIQHAEMKDDVTKLYISKKDITTGEELPGAHLVIKDKDGNIVEEWDSTTEPHYIEKLPIGSYTLTETKPADGYTTAETIAFDIQDTAEIQHVEMKDDVTKVYISKQDITTKKELPGAVLIIKDADGNEVEKWTSTNEPHYIEKLPIGDYTLTEITAPDGYQKAETVKFEVADTLEEQHVVMYDSPNPTTPGPNSPQTGDTMNLPMIICGACAAALLLILGIAIAGKKKKKAKAEEDKDEEKKDDGNEGEKPEETESDPQKSEDDSDKTE